MQKIGSNYQKAMLLIHNARIASRLTRMPMRHQRFSRVAELDSVAATACGTRLSCSIFCNFHIRRPHSLTLTNFARTRYTRCQQICQLNSSIRTDNQQFIGWVPTQYYQARRTAPCYLSQFRDKLLAPSSVRSTQRRFTTVALRATHIGTRFHNQHSRTTATHTKGRRQTQYAEPDTKMGPHMLGLL